MNKFRRYLGATLVALALSATIGSASAGPRLYCGVELDRVCRILCPRCAVQSAAAPRAAQLAG